MQQSKEFEELVIATLTAFLVWLKVSPSDLRLCAVATADMAGCWCCYADGLPLLRLHVAKKHFAITLLINGETIPHDKQLNFSGARIDKPAAPGTGILSLVV